MLGATLLVTCACVRAALAQAPSQVIYSTIQTSLTSEVPGLPGLKFANDTTGFERPYRSASGRFWIIKAFLNVATTADDEIILRGSGLLGETMLRENDQAPWATAGYLSGTTRAKMSVNNLGHFALGSNLAGTAPTTADEQIVAWANGFTAVATEGDPGPAGEAYGSVLHSARITNDDKPLFVASSTVGRDLH